MRPVINAICIFLLSFMLAGVAPAQEAGGPNRLDNPDFDSSLIDWSFNPGEADWDPLNVVDSTDSGSALVRQDAAGFVSLVSQCVPVTAGEVFGMHAWVNVPAGQNPDGRAGVEINWYADAGCSTGDLGGIGRELGSLVEGGWAPVRVAGSAPAAAEAARAVLSVRNISGGFDWLAHFDNAFFDEATAFSGALNRAAGDATIGRDGQGNLVIGNIGTSGEDGVDIEFGGTGFLVGFGEITVPTDLAGAVTPSDLQIELTGPLAPGDTALGAALQWIAHVGIMVPSDRTPMSRSPGAGASRAVTPSNLVASSLVATRVDLNQGPRWLVGPLDSPVFPNQTYTLLLLDDGEVVVNETGRNEGLPTGAVPGDLMMGVRDDQLEFRLRFQSDQTVGESLSFDEAVIRSEINDTVDDLLPAVQLRAFNLPAVQLAGQRLVAEGGRGGDVLDDGARIGGLGEAVLTRTSDGRVVVENFGPGGDDGLKITPGAGGGPHMALGFGETIPAADTSGAVEDVVPLDLLGDPLAEFAATDTGTMFETRAEFFGTARASTRQTDSLRGSSSGTVIIRDGGAVVTEQIGFTGAVQTAVSLGSRYDVSVCDGGKLCNRFSWNEPIDIELEGIGTFTGDELVWIFADAQTLSDDVIGGIEYFGAELPARSLTKVEAGALLFRDGFEN